MVTAVGWLGGQSCHQVGTVSDEISFRIHPKQ